MLFLLQLPLPLAPIHPLKGRSIYGSHSSHILWYLVHFRLCSRARVTARLVHWLYVSYKPAEERDRQTGSEGVVRIEQENGSMQTWGVKLGWANEGFLEHMVSIWRQLYERRTEKRVFHAEGTFSVKNVRKRVGYFEDMLMLQENEEESCPANSNYEEHFHGNWINQKLAILIIWGILTYHEVQWNTWNCK